MTRAFDSLAAGLDYPMVIVTVGVGGERSGCLVGFTTQCSIEPPRWLVCVSKVNHTHGVAVGAGAMAVHFPTPAECAVAALFGEETGDEVDKFARCSWRPWDGDGQTPVLEEVGRRFVGRVVERFDAGDHTAFVLDVVDAAYAPGPQLGFQQVKDMPPGHPPEEAAAG